MIAKRGLLALLAALALAFAFLLPSVPARAAEFSETDWEANVQNREEGTSDDWDSEWLGGLKKPSFNVFDGSTYWPSFQSLLYGWFEQAAGTLTTTSNEVFEALDDIGALDSDYAGSSNSTFATIYSVATAIQRTVVNPVAIGLLGLAMAISLLEFSKEAATNPRSGSMNQLASYVWIAVKFSIVLQLINNLDLLCGGIFDVFAWIARSCSSVITAALPQGASADTFSSFMIEMQKLTYAQFGVVFIYLLLAFVIVCVVVITLVRVIVVSVTRLIEVYVMSAFAGFPLVMLTTRETRDAGVRYLRSYASVCLQAAVLVVSITRVDPTHISWGDQVGQALYVQKWGRSIRSDMLAMLTELPVNQVITIDVRPWDPNDAIELVESVGTDLTAQKSNYIRDHSQQMFVTDEMLPAPLNDALANVQSLRGDILDADEAMFTVGVSILTWAPTIEECDEAAKQVSERVRRFSYRISPLKNLQGQGFAAALPTGRFDIPYSRTMTSSPLACLIPFISVEIFDPDGMYMGQDRTSKNFVCYDRTKAIAPNGLILGMPGRGKSVAAKLQILWTKLKYHDAPTYIVDPEGEYGVVVEGVDGLEVTVGAGSGAHFNPLDIVLDDSESAALELKSDMIISAVEMMSGEITSKQKSLVDRCVGVIYERYLKTKDPEDMPILSDLYEALRAQPEDEAHDLATTIERFVVGQAATFNHRTNVDLANPLISFNIRDNGTNMRPIAELFVLEFIWQRAVQNRALGLRTWIFIDEFHLLLNNPSSAAYFVSLWARARKYGAIPTAITQNVSTFGDPERPELMTIFKNTDLFILLGQAPEDAKLLASALGLSGDHVNYLTKANEGCGIILASTRLVEFENRLPEGKILSLLNTKPGA